MGRRDADREVNEELRAYLDLLIDEKMRAGHSQEEARRAALLELGGLTQVAEEVRDVRAGAWLAAIGRDCRYALRTMRRDAGFSITAAATLAIGIGASITIFTVSDAVLLRTLPVPHPEQLVLVGKPTAVSGHTTGGPRGDLFSLPLYRDLRDHNSFVTTLAATGTAERLDVRTSSGTEDEHPYGRFVSGNYFDVLGVGAARGRVFTADDDRVVGASPVAVVSDGYFRRRFGGATDVIGRAIDVDGTRITIIGVTPAGFTGEILERPVDLWLPISLQPVILPHSAPIEDRGTSWLLLLGRLRPGVTLGAARAGFTTLIHQFIIASDTMPGAASRDAGAPTVITSGARGISAVRREYAAPLRLLALGVALLLLIVCTNVANLLLARGIARGRELTLRLAIGAGRGQLVRQLLTESAVLALAGSVPGLLLAWWAGGAVLAAASAGDHPIATAHLDLRVLVFALGLTTLVVLLFGLLPALRVSGVDAASALRARGGSVTGRRSGRVPIGRLLIPFQVTLSLVLLVAAAMLVRGLARLETSDTGLDRDHLLVIDVDAARRDYRGEKLFNFARNVSRRLATMPGVAAVSYSQNGLFQGRDGSAVVAIPGFSGRAAEDSSLFYDLVGPGYARAIGAHLLRGRDIDATDRRGTPSVAVVNEALERFYFGHASAVGKTIYFDAGVPTTIVGVIADVKDHSLTTPPARRAYGAYEQQIGVDEHASLVFEVRAIGDPALLVRPARVAIAAVDPEVPLAGIMPLTTVMRASIREQELVAGVATGFGVIALLLAAVGLYGVMTYAVRRRANEMGVRTALGAARRDLLWLVLGDGMRLVGWGIASGLPLSIAAARLVRAELPEIAGLDLVSMLVALSVLAISAFVAAMLPALLAARVEPVVALRLD